MTSVTKLFKTLRDAPSKGVKRHITNEIVGMYCATPALVKTLLEETLFLSESSAWEDRVAGSRVLEELFKSGAIEDTFSQKEYALGIEIDRVLEMPKFLATHYSGKETVKGGKDFIDLEDHNVVLGLSDISLPGTRSGEGGLLRKKKQALRVQKDEEKTEIESKEQFYQCVLSNLESYVWEKRHGASQLLLGIFRGMRARPAGAASLGLLSSKRYVECMLRVLILDRFNDYEMDIAVSPVRETVAKALKELVPFLAPATIKELLALLTKLGAYEDWQIKYSGLLGLQYIQDVVSPEEHKPIIVDIGNTCLALLNDLDEDVKRVAAGILMGLFERYCEFYSGAPEERIRESIDEVISIEDTVEGCWDALEEEEDLAISKAKIMGLLEKIARLLKHDLGKITRKRWMYILCLIRNPIDTVRLSVLSLLSLLPVQDPASLAASLLFSIMAEQEAEIREKTAELFKRVAAEGKVPGIQSIVHGFLQVVCGPAVVGMSSLASLNLSVIVGESDICSTDDGCKSLGEGAVLSGRVEVFKVLMSSSSEIRECVSAFFMAPGKQQPYFAVLKAVASAILMEQGAQESGARLLDSLLAGAEDKDRNDLARAAHSLALHIKGAAAAEDAEILVYTFNTPTPVALLQIMAAAVRAALGKFDEFFKLAIECVCAREESKVMEMVIKEMGEAKKAKLMEDIECKEPEWEMLTLFREVGDAFLDTPVFGELRASLGRCSIFLQSTIECFSSVEKLQFIFEYAMEKNLDRIVSALIKKSPQKNEEFILAAKKKLEEIVCQEKTDHTEFLAFIVEVVPHSQLHLLVAIAFPLVTAMNTPFYVEGTRELASKAFSAVAPAMWLRTESAVESPELEKEVKAAKARVGSLMEPDALPKVEMKVELREYQRKGVEWMGFLRKSGLSGMLCDDMGLGKTVQVLAFLAGQMGAGAQAKKAALVLCPSALTGHWHMEITSNFPTLKSATIDDFGGSGVCISSFDKFRLNYSKFVERTWFYLVLDEGHIIRNSNTLLHQRVKMVRAENRLLLSGTPIQNSVGELWALFDILMPGFLGKEKDFSREYIKPIEKAREGKGTPRDAEIAKAKLEELHSSVLPFILRRMKETVLSDLPPKVISDIYVDLEEVQQKVYDGLAAGGGADGEYGKVSSSSGNFSLLTRLIKTCSHVSLLAGNELPFPLTQKEKSLAPSGKISALLDLLKVMVQTSKILVFCQYKATIDRVIKEVEAVLPEVRWTRLDGTVKGDERPALAKKFNTDAEISIMYLTTHAGGLGLNLTGADAVIFFEHDWNPMTDLQAMDRAHRIGQKKSVSVFRLISKKTIEESIMSLQRFKNYIASTVVNQQNVEIESMDTSNALERLVREKAPKEKETREEEYHDFI
ncbi:TATA-binding protein-associated factor [Nematocida major]|uniref:TATA-binding protein-associated factor n=1 Tax=Nematocida major TaxID=1912982 RepID=UPI00200776EF|nr:TATA-binding protein-associated factor [Nematocida major]KAH9386380.1 TATA-binding protein-associated factor [Nematocida major]